VGRGLRPSMAWALTVLVWFGLQSSLAVLARLLPGHATNVVALGFCELLVLGGAAVFLSRSDPDRPGKFPVSFALDGARAHTVVLAAGFGLCLHPAADALRGWIETFWATPPEQLEAKLAVLAHDTAGRTIALFLVIALIGPFLEELFYRGVIFTRVLWSSGVRWASFVGGAGFVFAHGDVRDWPSLALVAAALTWLRVRTKSLWASVACHAAFNASTLVWLVLGAETVPGGLFTVLAATAVGAGLLVTVAHTTRSVP
jgi:membrane protease YdiL (CAAX protease family)